MDIIDDNNATYKLLKTELGKIGYKSTEHFEGGKLIVEFTSPSKKVWRINGAHIRYPFSDNKIRNLCIDKNLSNKFVESLGISIPHTKFLQKDDNLTVEDANGLLKKYKKLIVKPVDSTLSRGLTMNIVSAESLYDAIDFARQTSASVVIQEQVEGEEIRFVVMEGKVEAALLRRTARVVGDGKSSVAKLIEIENKAREKLTFKHIKYPPLSESIVDRILLGSSQILPKGEVLELSRATMVRNGASVYDVFSQVDRSYINSVEKIVKELGAKFIVVDVFVKDFTKKQDDIDKNYWFIEFNTAPVMKLFYGCRDGKMFDILPKLTKLIDKHLHQA